jgi:8-amino-7-oxononanoate synthase
MRAPNTAPTAAFEQELSADLEVLRRAGLFRKLRRVSNRNGAVVDCDGRTVVDFASNDYLGLASDARLGKAALDAAGGAAFGAAAARLVSGNSAEHELLEREIARFKQCEAAVLFSSGYAANVGTIPALAGKRDVIYSDELNHASLIDACRLSRAEVRVLPHLDVGALRSALSADAGRFRRHLIVVDAVFSMDGDLYPLPQLVTVAREHGAWTYVDDAHGTGVLGANGRGAAEHWGVEGKLDVVMGTLGKALGGSGAFVAGSRTLADFLVNRARTFVYTTGTAPLLAAASVQAIHIVEAEGWRRSRLRENARLLRGGLARMGLVCSGEPDGHIVAVLLGEAEVAMRIGATLLEAGYLVGAIRPPTVPMGSARLRITLSAAHGQAQVDGLLLALSHALAGVAAASGGSVR